MFKVIMSMTGNSFEVVRSDYGSDRFDEKGRKYMYMPLPMCRVPIGHGRDEQAAKNVADMLCAMLNERADLIH